MRAVSRRKKAKLEQNLRKKVESWKIVKFTENKREFRILAFETNLWKTRMTPLKWICQKPRKSMLVPQMETDDLMIKCHECKLL